MKKVNPFKNQQAALKALDNGGRFYNFLTKPDDGEITSAELSKVAGVYSSKPLMNLYLEMSIIGLASKDKVMQSMSNELKADYEQHRPLYLTPAQAYQSEQTGKTAIVKGVPKYKRSKTEFNSFIMVPIVTGNVTTFAMIPIFDEYDVYELKDEQTKELFILAHARCSKQLAERETRFGGLLKELQLGKEETSDKKSFLEISYYTPL